MTELRVGSGEWREGSGESPKLKHQRPLERFAVNASMICDVGSPADVALQEASYVVGFIEAMASVQQVTIMPGSVTLRYTPEHDIEAPGDCYHHSHLLITGYARVPKLVLP